MTKGFVLVNGLSWLGIIDVFIERSVIARRHSAQLHRSRSEKLIILQKPDRK